MGVYDIDPAAGSRLDKQQVLFSWALSECFSPRWSALMAEGLSEELRRRIAQGQSSGYPEAQCRELITRLESRRAEMLSQLLDRAAGFRLIHVPAELLEMLPVLPECGWKEYPVLLGQYVNGPHKPDSPHDPRAWAKRYRQSPPPANFTGYPLLAYSPKLKCHTLVDGYSRCIGAILRLREGKPASDMRMIYAEAPVSA